MSSLETGLAALAERSARLRKLSGLLFLAGAFAFLVAMVVVWPERASVDALDETRLLAPAELAAVLGPAGVEVPMRTAVWLDPAESSLRMQYGLLAVALWLIWRLTAMLPFGVRVTVVTLAMPFVLGGIGKAVNDQTEVPTVAVGHVAERAGQPLPERRGRARTRNGEAPQQAYHLDAARFSGPLADQAHFVLAQQAYHNASPADVARHLRALTGGWRPDMPVAQSIMGVLDDYARAHQQEAGLVAAQIAHGRPHYAVRFQVAAWSVRLGALLLLLGLALDVTGMRRSRAAKRLRGAIPAAVSIEAPALGGGARTGFGLRASQP